MAAVNLSDQEGTQGTQDAVALDTAHGNSRGTLRGQMRQYTVCVCLEPTHSVVGVAL